MNDNTDKAKRLKQQQLRTKAEAQLVRNEPVKKPATAQEIDELLHELHERQRELEQQNDELQQAQVALELSSTHYIELYDFAPVGYLSLTAKGKISEINLTGAKLLSLEREKLINQRFSRFIPDQYKDLWYRHFIQAKQSTELHGCELPYGRADGTTRYAHLDCRLIKGYEASQVLHVTMTDITQRKLADESLRILR